MNPFIKISEITSKKKMVFRLASRSRGYAQESGELALTFPSTAFRNVCRHRRRGSAKLSDKTKPFLGRKRPRNTIDLQHPQMGFLPNFQLPKISHMFLTRYIHCELLIAGG